MSASGALSRLRLVLQPDRPGCRHCAHLLLPCPRGLRCPGSPLTAPAACPDCSWGLRCPDHGREWTTA